MSSYWPQMTAQKGRRGSPRTVLQDSLNPENMITLYTCGPTPMMARLSGMVPAGTPVEVSLENYFGCGIGLCVGCTVETDRGFRRACIDGPVMDGRHILWDTLTH